MGILRQKKKTLAGHAIADWGLTDCNNSDILSPNLLHKKPN